MYPLRGLPLSHWPVVKNTGSQRNSDRPSYAFFRPMIYVTIPQTHSQFSIVSPKDGRTRHLPVFCLED